MPITDELRKWADDNTVRGEVLTTLPAQHPIRGTLESLVSIADRIDAEHEAKIAYWQEASYKDGYDEGFASADDWLAQHEDAMAEHGWIRLPKDAMAEHGWIRLPKDADGEYIHVGDELRDEWHEQNQGEVQRLMLDHDGWWLKLKTSCERFYVHDFHEWHHRRHKPPTVEDVLREFAGRVCNSGHQCGLDAADTIAEYAAKLRLVGDGE